MKLRSTILGLVLVKLMLSSSLFAQTPSTNAARLNVALVRGFPGVGVDVPITLHNTGTVVAAQFDLGYPLGHLVPGVPGPGNFDGNVAVRSRQVSPGVLRYLIYSPQNSVLKTNGTVGTLPVSVPAGERTGGAMTASAVVMAAGDASLVRPVQVQSGGVLVSQVFRADDGLVYLLFNAESNQTYVVQAATNLVNWVNISTNTATSDYFTLTDTGAVGLPYRFFRAVPVAGP